jgi:hypothetical protein
MEIISIILEAVAFSLTAFMSVLVLAFIFRVFTRDEFPTWIGIFIGLAFVGFEGGLVEITKAISLLTVSKILFGTVLAVWGGKFGNKLAEKFMKPNVRETGYHLLRRTLYKARGKDYIEITMPSASEIQNLYGKKPVSNDLKRELGGKKFVLPSDLPIEILEKRIVRRLLNDWGIGDAEVKLDEHGSIVKLAVAAKKTRLGSKVPEGKVLFSFKPESVPFELCYGDKVDIFIRSFVLRKIEVLNVEDGAILVMLDTADAEKLAKKISAGNKPSIIVFTNYKEDKKTK